MARLRAQPWWFALKLVHRDLWRRRAHGENTHVASSVNQEEMNKLFRSTKNETARKVRSVQPQRSQTNTELRSRRGGNFGAELAKLKKKCSCALVCLLACLRVPFSWGRPHVLACSMLFFCAIRLQLNTQLTNSSTNP